MSAVSRGSLAVIALAALAVAILSVITANHASSIGPFDFGTENVGDQSAPMTIGAYYEKPAADYPAGTVIYNGANPAINEILMDEGLPTSPLTVGDLATHYPGLIILWDITAAFISGTDPSDWYVDDSSCPFAGPPDPCESEVIFAPETGGAKTAILTYAITDVDPYGGGIPAALVQHGDELLSALILDDIEATLTGMAVGPSPTPSPTPSPIPTASPTPSPTPVPTVPPSSTVAPTITPTATATPTDSATPTGTASATPNPSITVPATPTASPTPSPDLIVVWGDNNCSNEPDPVDSLLALRFDAGLPTDTGDCPDMGEQVAPVQVASASLQTWGDVDCSGEVDPVDSLKLLRFDAGLSVSQEPDCPDIGADVSL